VFAFVGHIDLSSRKTRDGLQGMVAVRIAVRIVVQT
jgi:hypothetical protein